MNQPKFKLDGQTIMMVNPRINGISVDELFDCYDTFNFLYKEKKEKLSPILPIILKNWRKAMGLPWEYFMLLTHRLVNGKQNEFSSVSAWRSTSEIYNIQHMVSNQAENTRLILNEFLEYLTDQIHERNGIQVFYQPKTSFAFNMFNHLTDKVGEQATFKFSYAFMSFPFLVRSNPSIPISVKPLNKLNESEKTAFFELVSKKRSKLYTRLQDLDKKDYHLKGIHRLYAKYGLFRNREVNVFFDERSGKILGTLIMSRASLGLNFSLIENSTELIINDDVLASPLASEIIHFILVQTRSFYENMQLGFLPLLTHPDTEQIITELGGKKLRRYDYFLCTNEAYAEWKHYLTQELESVRIYKKLKLRGGLQQVS